MHRLGWTSERAAQLAALDRPDLIPARVAGASRGRLSLLTADGPRSAVVPGRLRRAGDVPVAGDWVALGTDGMVHAVLPRRGAVARAAPDGRAEPQVLAANVDVALVLGSLNRDLNVRRLERMLTLAADARADAVVVLTKADLVADPAMRAADVRLALGATVPVLALSVHAAERGGAERGPRGGGLDALAAWLQPGATAVMLGSSGVGKTTLLNALAGANRRTAPVRASDDRGRHATTERELVPLASGALLIDTPGLRLPRVWEQAGGLEAAFADVEELARGCRFADCRHAGEPGCAVAGRVPADRLRALARLRDERSRTEERRRGRVMAKALRSRLAAKRGGGR